MKKPQFLLLFLLISSCFAQYDVIFVGIGTSSSIALSKLVQAFPEKQFLALDMGGPTAAQIGGTNFPSYMPSGTTNRATITDVPGEYSNIAFNPQGEPYRLPFFDFAWQGKAFGGNSQFNGMLYQEPPTDYMESLPTGWKSANLQTYFNELRSTMTINNTPSKDRQTYLGGIHDILSDIYKNLGWTSQDTSKLGGLTTPYYSRPYVATDGNGQRGGPVSGYLSKVIGANGQSSKSNLVVIRNAQVNQILFNGNTATGVSYNNGVQATLKAGGRVVLGAGALVTPRLLYLSGVGPKGSEGAVMDVGGRTFKINNARVGKNVYDHAGTPITFQYNGTRPVQFMDYTDTNSANNQAAITQYKNSRSGAYAQYGPVSVAHAKSDTSKTYPNFELFVNPSTPGQTKTFQMVSMLLRTRGTRQFGLDFQDNVKNPQIWFSDDNDANDQTNAIILTVNQVLSKNTNIKITSGPASMDFNTVKNYVKSQVFIMNHYSGTVPLVAGDETVGGVNPADVRLRGTTNVHVVDASILPGIIPCHPVAIIMAVGAKSADLIAASIRSGATSAATSTSSSTSTSAASSSSVPTSTGTTPAAYLYYSFDAVSGTTVTDGSGNGRTGTLQNGPSVVAGKVGNGLKFSQINTMQQIQVSNGNTLAGSFSASFWMNPEDKNNLAKLLNAKVNWNDANGWTVELDSSTNFINFVASGQYTAKFSVPNLAYGQFSHVAIVVDNQKVSLYINGNLSGSTTFDSTAAVVKAGAPAPLYIGANNKSAGNGFNGIIDEFRLFSVALTQAQVTQLYNLK